jgi:hypothetical protein
MKYQKFHEQLEFDIVKKPKPEPKPRFKMRVRGAGVIRSNMDIGHLMAHVDRIGMKHHDIPIMDSTFDDYGY